MAGMNDRGQLILIAAVLIATTILGSVVLLNSIHASADTNAYKEGQSLDQTNRVTEQVKKDLRALYLAEVQADGQPAGFITDTVAFNNTVKNYSRQYTNLTSISSSSILWVEYNNDTSSTNGLVLRQNGTDNFVSEDGTARNNPWYPIRNADDVPYIFFNITKVDPPGNGQQWKMIVRDGDGNGGELEVNKVASGVEVTVNNQFVCNSDSNPISTPFEIEITEGFGIIQTEERTCAAFELATFDIEEIEFEEPKGAQGNYTIIPIGNIDASDSEMNQGSEQQIHDDVIVNPGFRIRYEDPSGNYEANTTVFGGSR